MCMCVCANEVWVLTLLHCYPPGYLSLWENITNEEEEEREKRRAKTAPLQRRGWSQVRANGCGCVSRTSCYMASYLSCDFHVTPM